MIAEGDIYGSDVIPRTTVLTSARKTFLLFEEGLTEGMLKAFFVYVHGAVDFTIADRSNVSLYLQVWREVEDEEFQYELVYQKKVYVNASTPLGLLYSVKNISLFTGTCTILLCYRHMHDIFNIYAV